MRVIVHGGAGSGADLGRPMPDRQAVLDASPRNHLDWLRGRFGGHDTVGDVPQVGAGFYCTPAGGASATGAGEDIARVTLSRRPVNLLEGGATADRAATLALDAFENLTDSTAGVIVCGPEATGSATNASMQVAVATD